MATSPEWIQKRLSRRTLLLGGLQGLAFAGLAGRLAHLQFIHADRYTMMSEENRIKLNVVPPIRGVVNDRAGMAMADNRVNYRLFLDREEKEKTLASLRRLARILDFSPEKRQELTQKVSDARYGSTLLLQENMPWEAVVKTEFHMADLPGVSLKEGQLRHYPLGNAAAHLIGYVGRVTQEDIDKQQALARLPEFKIGKNGVEERFEHELRGKAGQRELEVNARGIAVRELSYEPFVAGDALNLTIDAELQQYAAERLGEESGSVIVMDAHRGELLACVSMPAFDPNRFSAGISSSYWNSLLEDERKPLVNKALSGQYPPASTFKMIVGLAGLEAGVINRHSTTYCPGHFDLGNRRFNCWKAGGHGTVNLQQALAESCDTYFYEVGEQLSIDAITGVARRFGFGESSGLELIGDKSGLLPSDEWKRRVHDTKWVKGDTINASIGQGFVLATPMQLATMTARLVSGKQLQPRLHIDNETPAPSPLQADASHLQLLLSGMNAVCNDRDGTAYWHRIQEEDMAMGGKTGTAQVKRILRRGQDQSTLPWRHRHHALFVGYAPVSHPDFVISVVIEHGGGGASAAAPVARDVLLKAQQLAAQHPGRYHL